ncbi:MAG: hypothetical protein N2255_05955, partial [Kiritimatiellae bacterium]|nr:hypothetical protein [Kiritimatiellia bacterium]
MLRFHDLSLCPELLHGIHDLRFRYCSPFQTATLPEVLRGRDLVAVVPEQDTDRTTMFLVCIFQRIRSVDAAGQSESCLLYTSP